MSRETVQVQVFNRLQALVSIAACVEWVPPLKPLPLAATSLTDLTHSGKNLSPPCILRSLKSCPLPSPHNVLSASASSRNSPKSPMTGQAFEFDKWPPRTTNAVTSPPSVTSMSMFTAVDFFAMASGDRRNPPNQMANQQNRHPPPCSWRMMSQTRYCKQPNPWRRAGDPILGRGVYRVSSLARSMPTPV